MIHAVALLLLTAVVVGPLGAAEPVSDLFSSVVIEETPSIHTKSEGDLWPTCWGPDDALYTANGDGYGFSRLSGPHDVCVSRITGGVRNLSGTTLATGDSIASIWTPGGGYNRKPTGITCINGVLYLAVQDLARDFNDAPAASISRSDDFGRTWKWNRSAPMFRDHVFTTLMFLDYGKNARHAPRDYVYVYGLDNNWRDSFNDRVPDPTALYLARVPRNAIQKRSAWRFYAGTDATGEPAWSANIGERRPVLETLRRVYPKFHADRGIHNMTVLSQGGVVYNPGLKRYLYTSWTEYTFEFYEAPRPWGPWRLFHRKDFGAYPWTEDKMGGYGCSIPSKFISADGRTMYIQDNTFVGGVGNYRFSLRRMVVTPGGAAPARNLPDASRNLAGAANKAVPIAKTFHHGHPEWLIDGRMDLSEDDWDQEDKPLSWWGVAWPRAFRFDRVVFTSGAVFDDGGWFRERPRVEVRRGGEWVAVKEAAAEPPFTPGRKAPGGRFTFRFPPQEADGVRVIGAPDGSRTFTSAAEFEVYYDGRREGKPASRGQATVPPRRE